jgi:1-acyl-sn-glycerol-3-phosphate acyltransferase
MIQVLKDAHRVGYVLARTVSVIGESFYKRDHHSILKERWGREMVRHIRMDLQVKGEISRTKPQLFVGNHISYIDIVVLMRSVENISFVAKAEVAKWPIFGAGAKRAGTVFLQRGDKNSRREVREQLGRVLTETESRIAVFPSGTTTLDESKHWKRGIFEIAHKHDISVSTRPSCSRTSRREFLSPRCKNTVPARLAPAPKIGHLATSALATKLIFSTDLISTTISM